MRLLFLDIDGVLNSTDLMRRGGWNNGTRSLDPECVRRLARIMTESGCAVVISSTWRKRESLPRIQEYLGDAGLPRELTFRIIGATGDLSKSMCRGEEVGLWLKALGGDPPFVILDDDSDLEPYLDHLVPVSNTTGLTDADVEEVLRRFT
jgi:hypothetical protein